MTHASTADAAVATNPAELADVAEPDEPPALAQGGGDGGGDTLDERGGGGGGGGEPGGGGTGLSWPRVVVLSASLVFLGVAVGMFVSRERPPGEGSVDVGFARDMLTHHQQALELAADEVTHGEDPVVRSYAREVLTFQAYEIGVMQETLRDWGYRPDERPAEAMGWMGMSVPWRDMTGLLTDEQMDAMQDARGARADALFLELMAEHHRGGLHMAEYAADEVQDTGLRDLARRMARNQAQEINEYRVTAEREGIPVEIEPAEVPHYD